MVCVKCGYLSEIIKVYENKKALFTKGFSFRYQLNYNYDKKSKLNKKSAKFVQNKN